MRASVVVTRKPTGRGAEKMLQIKVGVQLASLKLPLGKALLAAREMGAEAVEIDARGELRPEDLSHTGVRQVRKMLDDLNLRVSAVSFRTRRGYHVLDDLEARIDATRRALRLALRPGLQCGGEPHRPRPARGRDGRDEHDGRGPVRHRPVQPQGRRLPGGAKRGPKAARSWPG